MRVTRPCGLRLLADHRKSLPNCPNGLQISNTILRLQMAGLETLSDSNIVLHSKLETQGTVGCAEEVQKPRMLKVRINVPMGSAQEFDALSMFGDCDHLVKRRS